VKHHLSEIQSYCRQLNRRHAFLAAALAVVDGAIFWGIVAAVNAWVDPVREGTALILLLAGIPVVGGAWLWAYRRYRPAVRLDMHRLAQRIERSHPELNDLLVTAADLESREREQPNPLESHVLSSASSRLHQLEWKKRVTHPLERPASLVAAAAVAALLALMVLGSEPMEKAVHHFQDRILGRETGLVLEPIPTEVPVGRDLTVSMQINRWEKTATMEWLQNGERVREPVVIDDAGAGRFTFYDLGDSLRFRVRTPSLKTAWQAVDVYEPARIEAATIEIRPPHYTGQPEDRFDSLEDLTVLEGTRINFTLQSAAAESIHWQQGEATMALQRVPPASFALSFEARQSGPYRFRLTDAEGRAERSPEFILEVQPDQPPVVEILQPTEDAVFAPDQGFVTEIYAADDFGLAEADLHLSLSGSEPVTVPLPLAPQNEAGNDAPGPLTEAEIRTGIDLASLGAADGDFLALHVVVADNREPEPNRVRSDLLFVELRLPVPPIEMDGMPMEQRQLDFRSIIEEQKRVLRETYRLQSLPKEEQTDRLPLLASALSAAAVEINRILTEVRPVIAGSREDLMELFRQALDANRAAIDHLQKQRPEASLDPQSTSLSALLKLENAFRQNIRSKEPTEGGSGQGQSAGEPSEDQQQAGEQSESPGEQLEAAREALQSLIARQNRINQDFEESARTGWTQEEAAEAAGSQGEAIDDAAALDARLQRIADTAAVRGALSGARDHMNQAAARAGTGNADMALRSGLRSRESLRMAAAELESLIDAAATRDLQAAAEAATNLARRQREAAEASAAAAAGTPSDAELAAMEAAQRELKDQFESLLEAMNQRAGALSGSSPEVSRALSEATSAARDSGISPDMERAANALLYGQPGMARGPQESAAGGLDRMAAGLAGSGQEIASSPTNRARALNRELQATLEELASYARSPDAAPEGRLPEIRDQWSRRLQELAEISGNARFGGLANQLGTGAPSSWDGQLAQARQVLQQSAGLLRDFLFDEASVTGLDLNRQAAPPPDQYRRMVEAYFRRLANEPDPEE
jgi:hypothetical protein